MKEFFPFQAYDFIGNSGRRRGLCWDVYIFWIITWNLPAGGKRRKLSIPALIPSLWLISDWVLLNLAARLQMFVQTIWVTVRLTAHEESRTERWCSGHSGPVRPLTSTDPRLCRCFMKTHICTSMWGGSCGVAPGDGSRSYLQAWWTPQLWRCSSPPGWAELLSPGRRWRPGTADTHRALRLHTLNTRTAQSCWGLHRRTLGAWSRYCFPADSWLSNRNMLSWRT